MMIVEWSIVLVVAIVDWIAVAKDWKKVEYIAKPLTMMVLFMVLLRGLGSSGYSSLPLASFGAGLLFSLAGDIFLLFSNNYASQGWFLAGLTTFLLAHLSYISGLNLPFGPASPLWAVGIAILLAIIAGRVLQSIVAGVRNRGLQNMVIPVEVYGVVITIMLLSAVLTFFRPNWQISAAMLVSLGAALFFASDVILAWNKFVNPVKNGRLVNMIAYHLGQMALIGGVLLNFAK